MTGTNDELPHELVFDSQGNNALGLTGQTGTMIRVENKIFAVQQNVGILVINAITHSLETTLTVNDGEFGTLTLAKDGNLWAGTSATATGSLDDDTPRNVIVKINPYTLEQENISLPSGITAPTPSWGAWRADPIAASNNDTLLYWTLGGSWNGNAIYQYDINDNTGKIVFDANDYPPLPEGAGWRGQGKWTMYGTGFGLHPVTEELFVPLVTMDENPNNRNHWQLVKINPNTGESTIIPMKDYFWWIAMAVFPDNYAPTVQNLEQINVNGDTAVFLGDKVHDPDNLETSIVKTVENYDQQVLNVYVKSDSLVVKTKVDILQTTLANLTLKVNSNGKIVRHNVRILLQPAVAQTQPEPEPEPEPDLNPFQLTLQQIQLFTGQKAQLALTAPQLFDVQWSSTNQYVANVNEYGTVEALNPGQVYIVAKDLDSDKADSCLITVQTLPVDDNGGEPTYPPVQTHVITLSNNQLNLTTGQMNRLYLQLSYTDMQNVTLQWNSSDYNIADVTQTGLVIAKNTGTAAVTVMTSNGGVAVCNVNVTKTLAQPTVNDVGDNHANVQFTVSTAATYYLLHVYQSNYSNGIPTLTPLYTLKVLADGTTVNTKSRNGNTISVDLNNLTQGNNCIVWIEALTTDELGNSKSVALETLAFTTLKATGNGEVETSSTGNAYYQNGTLTLTNMQESVVTLFNLNGNVILTGEVKLPTHTVYKKLQTGVYFLKQRYENVSKTVKIVVK
jgi:hypothetical protein